jgi:hypothetical protein
MAGYLYANVMGLQVSLEAFRVLPFSLVVTNKTMITYSGET